MLQEGKSSLLKTLEVPISELFEDYINLLLAVYDKFQPEVLTLVEVPPMVQSEQSRGNKWEN